MSDVPETIWAWDDLHHVESNPHNHFATEYRRADLPATDAQALANEKVEALVEVAELLADSFEAYENAAVDHMDFQAACFEALFKTRAALAQLKEPANDGN